jgi:Tfp pilus assembly protein PilW
MKMLRNIRARRRAFTLTELLIGSTIGIVLIAAILTTFSIVTRNFKASANYGLIHREGRYAVDIFSKEFRAATNITNASTNSITIAVPTDFSATGDPVGTMNIRYYQNGTNLVRHVLTTGASTTLVRNASTVSFKLFDRLGQSTSLTASAKGCQVEIKLRKTVAGTAQTEDFLSARLTLRNKP